MRILLINSVCGIGSTGRICTDLARKFEDEGHEVKIAYGRDATVPDEYMNYAVRIGSDLSVKWHGVLTRLFDAHGFGSRISTKKFLKWAEGYKPDLLWLHNIHGYYINIELLFQWIKKHPEMEVKWTLHDCWTFTGHCSHFTIAKCDKWKSQCESCPQKHAYPESILFDRSRYNFDKKKRLFSGVSKLRIITPSKWLADLVKQSFLQEYDVEVVYNTIDTNVFKPTPSDFREKHGLKNKKIVLGVATAWNKSKGLDDFIELSKMLDNNYKIVLVGIAEEQKKYIPKNILCLPRTNSPKELAEIYSAADVLLNLSLEEVYPTVNLEAQACGTPVITYDVGGGKETIENGMVVDCSLESLLQAIYHNENNSSICI